MALGYGWLEALHQPCVLRQKCRFRKQKCLSGQKCRFCYIFVFAEMSFSLHGGIPCTEYYEDVLEILSYLTYYSPVLSPRLWELFPLIYCAFNEWAYDYLENMVTPLDNYISRGTDVFVSSQNPDLVGMIYAMCAKVQLFFDGLQCGRLLDPTRQPCWPSPMLDFGSILKRRHCGRQCRIVLHTGHRYC